MREETQRNSLQPGHMLMWYRIDEILGQGGFGITYLAYDTNLDQDVAIKEYLPMELAVRDGDDSVHPASSRHDDRYKWGLDRFLAEARTLARFKHPAIVRVLSVFEANNTAYMVMEYQHGRSLGDVLERRGTLPERELLAILVPLLSGLDTIHAQGFIHRDIKPDNVFIREDGAPVLLDFGSARQALGEETRTLTSVVSPGYAPFEQYYSKSDRQGPWTDIYGLGATLYRCVSGRAPMPAIDRSEAIIKAERDVFVSAREIGAGDYSQRFLAAIDSALAFDEKKRPQTVAAWRQAFGIVPRKRGSNTTRPAPPAAAGVETIKADTQDMSAPTVFNTESRQESASRRQTRSARTRTRSTSRATAPAATTGDESRTGPTRASTTQVEAKRPSRAPLLLLVFLLALIAAGGYGWYAGLLPRELPLLADNRDLLQQGDRALAAGLVYEPAGRSALFYYREAWDVDPADINASQGLRIVGERLVGAIDDALEAGDGERREILAALLRQIPTAVMDTTAVRERIAAALAVQRERAALGKRVQQELDAALAHLDAGRLVGSGEDNALARLRAAEILDPGNADAAQGMARLVEALVARGRKALDEGDTRAAGEWHVQASLLDASLPAVTALGERLRAAQSEADKAAELQSLLDRGDASLAANRLTSPAGNNALEAYRAVLEREPGNARATSGIRKVHDRYLALATQALARDVYDDARRFARRALKVTPGSEPANTLLQEIEAVENRRIRETADRARAAATARAAAARAAAERERRAAEERRKREQEAEALRLLEESRRRADEERRAAEAARVAATEAENSKLRVVFDYAGFHPKYAVHNLSIDTVYEAVAPLFRSAGYDIVKRDQVHDAGWQWNNVRLVIYRLTVNENTATGLYSWAGSVNVLGTPTLKFSLARALDEPPIWTDGENGLGPPTDLRRMVGYYVDMTKAFLNNRPGRVR